MEDNTEASETSRSKYSSSSEDTHVEVPLPEVEVEPEPEEELKPEWWDSLVLCPPLSHKASLVRDNGILSEPNAPSEHDFLHRTNDTSKDGPPRGRRMFETKADWIRMTTEPNDSGIDELKWVGTTSFSVLRPLRHTSQLAGKVIKLVNDKDNMVSTTEKMEILGEWQATVPVLQPFRLETLSVMIGRCKIISLGDRSEVFPWDRRTLTRATHIWVVLSGAVNVNNYFFWKRTEEAMFDDSNFAGRKPREAHTVYAGDALTLLDVDYVTDVPSSFVVFSRELYFDMLACEPQLFVPIRRSLIEGFSLFTQLPEEAVLTLASKLTPRFVPEGKWVFRDSDAADELYFIHMGYIDLTMRAVGTTEGRHGHRKHVRSVPMRVARLTNNAMFGDDAAYSARQVTFVHSGAWLSHLQSKKYQWTRKKSGVDADVSIRRCKTQRVYSARAVVGTQLFSLPASDALAVVGTDLWDILRQYARARLAEWMHTAATDANVDLTTFEPEGVPVYSSSYEKIDEDDEEGHIVAISNTLQTMFDGHGANAEVDGLAAPQGSPDAPRQPKHSLSPRRSTSPSQPPRQSTPYSAIPAAASPIPFSDDSFGNVSEFRLRPRSRLTLRGAAVRDLHGLGPRARPRTVTPTMARATRPHSNVAPLRRSKSSQSIRHGMHALDAPSPENGVSRPAGNADAVLAKLLPAPMKRPTTSTEATLASVPAETLTPRTRVQVEMQRKVSAVRPWTSASLSSSLRRPKSVADFRPPQSPPRPASPDSPFPFLLPQGEGHRRHTRLSAVGRPTSGAPSRRSDVGGARPGSSASTRFGRTSRSVQSGKSGASILSDMPYSLRSLMHAYLDSKENFRLPVVPVVEEWKDVPFVFDALREPPDRDAAEIDPATGPPVEGGPSSEGPTQSSDESD